MGDGRDLKRILQAAASAAAEDTDAPEPKPDHEKTDAERLLTNGPVDTSEPVKPGRGRIPENVMFMHPDSLRALR